MAEIIKMEVKDVFWVTDTGDFGTGDIVIMSPYFATVAVGEYIADSLHENDRHVFARHILHGGTIEEWEEDAGS